MDGKEIPALDKAKSFKAVRLNFLVSLAAATLLGWVLWFVLQFVGGWLDN
jgi:hypothetical protein